MKKALVISGGGSKGAFGAGVVCSKEINYDLYVGTSTGALIALMAAAGKYSKLKYLYNNFSNEMIYDSDPFNKKGQLSKFKVVMNLIKGKSSFGKTTKLLDLIRENYTIHDHYNIHSKNIEIVVVVSNMTTKKAEYKSSRNLTWTEFTYWAWISTLAYPYSETEIVNGCEYADGGFTVNFPIRFATSKSDFIDAIIHSPNEINEVFENENVLQGIPSIINMLMDSNMQKDIESGNHFLSHGKEINYIFTPYELTESSMFFDKKQMRNWFEMGVNQ